MYCKYTYLLSFIIFCVKEIIVFTEPALGKYRETQPWGTIIVYTTYIYTTLTFAATAIHLNPLTHSAIVSTNSAVVIRSLGGIVLLLPLADGSKAAFKLSDIFWITIF